MMQAEKAGNKDLLEKLEVERCIECGMCTYICPSKIEVTDMISKGKRRVQIANRMKKK
jgi:electron transport complex protein RnfC